MIPVPVYDLSTLGRGDDIFPPDIFVTVEMPPAPTDDIPFVNAAKNIPEYVKDWDHYVGQEPMKAQLRMYIESALRRWDVLEHVLLASGMPGVGKTTLARLIAKEMGAHITMLVPPFTQKTLYDAALSMEWGEVLFIDEIHKLADNGPRAAENLLHLLEERTLYLDTGVHHLEKFTVIGATTDADKLPETVTDRFLLQPFFQPYSLAELVKITKNFADYFEIGLMPETMVAIAKACRGTPRVARDLVVGAREIQTVTGNYAQPSELLAFKELDPDGMTRKHKAYLMALYQFFGREAPHNGYEFVAGEASLMSLLRENKPGLARLERFLIETGLVDRTPRGRRLTPRGIQKAQLYVATERRLSTG